MYRIYADLVHCRERTPTGEPPERLGVKSSQFAQLV